MKRASEILLYLFGAASLFSGFIYGYLYLWVVAEAFLISSILLSTNTWIKQYAAIVIGALYYVALFNHDNNITQGAEVALLCFPALNGEWKSYKTIVAQGFLFGALLELVDTKTHLNDAGLRTHDYVYTLAWVIPTIIRCWEKYAKDKQTNQQWKN